MFIRIYYNGCFKDISLSDIQYFSIGGSNTDNFYIADTDLVPNHIKLAKDGERVTMSCGGTVYFNGSQVYGATVLEPSQIFVLSHRYKISMLVISAYTTAAAVKNIGLKTAVTIGRNDDNDIVINSPIVSGLHAQIERRGYDYYIVDQESMNGTYLNSSSINESTLQDGDEVVIGDSLIVKEGNQLVVYGDSKQIRAKEDEPVPVASTVTFCGNCGTALKTGSEFCGYCGTRVGSVQPPAPESKPVDIPPSEPAYSASEAVSASAPVGGDTASKPKKSKKGIVIAIVVIAIVGSLAAAGFFARDYIMGFFEDIKTEQSNKSSSEEDKKEREDDKKKAIPKPTEKPTPTPKPTPEPITELVDEDGTRFTPDLTTSGEIKPNAELLSSSMIYLEGKYYAFPINLTDLTSDGWEHMSDPNVTSDALFKGDKLMLITKWKTDGETIEELFISIEKGIEFVLPGGITNKSTAADVVKVYGNPVEDTEFEDAGCGGDSILYYKYKGYGMTYFFSFNSDGTIASIMLGKA